MKVAILGGSFDPPHLGHALVAKQVKKFLNADQIWIMPCYLHPFDKKLSSYIHRFTMTKNIEDKDIKVSNFEIKQKKISFTIDSLDKLKKAFPKFDFYWIVGSEQLKDFQKWKNWQELIKKYNLIIFPRETLLETLELQVKKALKLKKIPKNIVILKSKDLIMINISSTKVREGIKNKQSIKYFVPKEIEEYILKNKLYQ